MFVNSPQHHEVCVCCHVTRVPLQVLVEFLSLGTLMSFTMVAASVIILRYQPAEVQPFKLRDAVSGDEGGAETPEPPPDAGDKQSILKSQVTQTRMRNNLDAAVEAHVMFHSHGPQRLYHGACPLHSPCFRTFPPRRVTRTSGASSRAGATCRCSAARHRK